MQRIFCINEMHIIHEVISSTTILSLAQERKKNQFFFVLQKEILYSFQLVVRAQEEWKAKERSLRCNHLRFYLHTYIHYICEKSTRNIIDFIAHLTSLTTDIISWFPVMEIENLALQKLMLVMLLMKIYSSIIENGMKGVLEGFTALIIRAYIL